MGGDVGVAAGPVGREASAATDAQLGAEILTYSRSKGAFIGASLKGTVITPDNDLNQAFYGINAKEVLNGGVNGTPYTVFIYPQTRSPVYPVHALATEGAEGLIWAFHARLFAPFVGLLSSFGSSSIDTRRQTLHMVRFFLKTGEHRL